MKTYAPPRAWRFEQGDEVIVVNNSRSRFACRGKIHAVHLDLLPTKSGTGATPTSARYEVAFHWNGFDEPKPTEFQELYDWELTRAAA